MFSAHMMAARLPFLSLFLPLFATGPFFLVGSTSLLLIRLCSSQAKSDESATGTIQPCVDQQQSTVWNNQIKFVLAGS